MRHICKQRLLCYADDPEDFDTGEFGQELQEEFAETEVAHIHALEGGRRSRPLKIAGVIQEREVTILIDTGRDRDFLHPRIAGKPASAADTNSTF